MAYPFRRITTNGQGQLSLSLSLKPSIACLVSLVSQADPGVSNCHRHPRPRSSSYPPHHNCREARSTHALGPTHSHSTPIQSNPVQPAQSCPVTVQSGPVKVHRRPTVQGRDNLEANPPLCLSCFASCSPLARPADLGPGAFTSSDSAAVYRILHSSSHRPAASVSVSICRLLSSLLPFTDLQPSLPGRLSSCHLPPLPPISPSRSLAAATTPGPFPHQQHWAARLPSAQIHLQPPTRPTDKNRPACQPCQTLYGLSASLIELISCYRVAPALSCDTSGRGESTGSYKAQGTTPAGIHLAGNLTD